MVGNNTIPFVKPTNGYTVRQYCISIMVFVNMHLMGFILLPLNDMDEFVLYYIMVIIQ